MPKSENSKAVAGRERKAAAAAVKQAEADAKREQKEAAEWSVGSNQRAAQRAAEAAAKAAEKEAQRKAKAEALSKIEAETEKVKTVRGATRRNIEKGEALAEHGRLLELHEAPALEASGLDAALDLLASVHRPADAHPLQDVERHPERRMKSAYAAWCERETPILQAENPQLKHSQLKNILFKRWKKSPENPMNQAHVAYNAKGDAAGAPGSGEDEED